MIYHEFTKRPGLSPKSTSVKIYLHLRNVRDQVTSGIFERGHWQIRKYTQKRATSAERLGIAKSMRRIPTLCEGRLGRVEEERKMREARFRDTNIIRQGSYLMIFTSKVGGGHAPPNNGFRCRKNRRSDLAIHTPNRL